MTLRHIPLSVLASGLFSLIAGIFLIQAIIMPQRLPDWSSLTAHGSTGPGKAAGPAAATLPDRALYSVIAARPLFFETRRPAPESGPLAAGSVPAPPIDFTLAGVVAAPGQRLAIVSKAGTGATSILHLGSVFEGWKVTSIQQTSVTVQSATTIISLKIAR